MIKQIGEVEIRPTRMALQLADRTTKLPYGIVEDAGEPKSAAIRELREETRIVSTEIIAKVCTKYFLIQI